LLHTPQRISTFMTTAPLYRATNILCGISISKHSDTVKTFSDQPASPALLTSNGPHGADHSRHLDLNMRSHAHSEQRGRLTVHLSSLRIGRKACSSRKASRTLLVLAKLHVMIQIILSRLVPAILRETSKKTSY